MARLQIDKGVYPDVSEEVAQSLGLLAYEHAKLRGVTALCEQQHEDLAAAEALLTEAQARVELKDKVIADCRRTAERVAQHWKGKCDRIDAWAKGLAERAEADRMTAEREARRTVRFAWNDGFAVGFAVAACMAAVITGAVCAFR